MNEQLKEKYYQIEDIIYNDLSPDKYCLIHNYVTNLYRESQKLNNTIKFVKALNSKGKNCRIYANVKLDILNKLRGKE